MKTYIPTYRLQLVRDGQIERFDIECAKDMAKALRVFFRSDREMFVAFYLNARNQIIAHHVVSMGTLNASLVHPREVFRIAIMKNAASILVAHNHPSNGVEPSVSDVELTGRLRDAGRLMGIELIDHLIVSPCGDVRSCVKCGV